MLDDPAARRVDCVPAVWRAGRRVPVALGPVCDDKLELPAGDLGEVAAVRAELLADVFGGGHCVGLVWRGPARGGGGIAPLDVGVFPGRLGKEYFDVGRCGV